MAHDYKKLLEDEGYILEQIIPHHRRGVKILIGKCSNGHNYESTTSSWGEGSRCKNCYYDSLKSHDYKKEVTQAGYNLIKQDKQKLKVSCSLGHIYDVYVTTWNEGSRCKQCFLDDQKKEIWDKYNRLLIEEGYKLLEIKQTEHGNRLICKCPNNHDYEVLYNNWSSGCRCSKCYQTSWTIEKVKELFEKEQYQLLSTDYKTTTDLYDFICPVGHQHKITLGSWLQGSRCGICKWKPFTIEQVVQQAQNNNLILKSKPKVHTDQLLLECKTCHYMWDTSYYAWNRCKDQGCVKCRGQAGYTYNDVKEILAKENYTLISPYVNCITKITTTCPKGHEYSFTFGNFIQGYRCCHCKIIISSGHQEIIDELKDLNPTINTRQIIKPKELDIYFEDKKLAIEYCGLYWHSDVKKTNPSYHYNKVEACNKLGVRLITIFEDEWINKKEVCLSRIKNALNICDIRVFARKCEAKQIDLTQAYEFLNKHHLQGGGKAEVAFGLFHNDQLIQVMTGGKPNRAHTEGQYKVLEMKRLASSSNLLVVGGAGKLFKLLKLYGIEKQYNRIKSYCDMRWGTGNLYKQLGFKLAGTTKYSPHYIKQGKRYRNQTLQKPRECKLTEKQYRLSQGYTIIYDCGHQTWVYDL